MSDREADYQHVVLLPPFLQSSSKLTLSPEQWEARLAAVDVPKADMNRLIMNFLVTEGYVEAARAFEQESGTPPGVELGAITDRMEIRKAVHSGNVEQAIERVNDLNPEVRVHGIVKAACLHDRSDVACCTLHVIFNQSRIAACVRSSDAHDQAQPRPLH